MKNKNQKDNPGFARHKRPHLCYPCTVYFLTCLCSFSLYHNSVYTGCMLQGNECAESTVWNEVIYDLGGHPLQLWGWGEVKSMHNWHAHRVLFTDQQGGIVGAAQILERILPKPFRRLCYVPRGPVCREGDAAAVYEALTAYVSHHLPGTLLTVEPDTKSVPGVAGWRRSSNTILIPKTLILDLHHSEEELLAAMTKKTRQYIRKSERAGITLRRIKAMDDVEKLLKIYHQTAKRANFALHDDQYYRDVHINLGDSSLIFAAYEGSEPIAFVWLAASQETAFELYGGMNERGQALRANYALKWFAIRKCREWGISRYDMNGLLNDGISNFKRGFANHDDMLAGTYDYPLSPLYSIWAGLLPTAKKIIRRIKH